MSDQPTPAHMEPRVARLEGAMETLVDSVDKVTRAVSTLSDKVDTRTAPNFTVMLALAGVVLTIVGMVAAPCAWFVVHELARAEQGQRDLDTKLQREFTLMNETVAASVRSIDSASASRHVDAVARVEKLESWRDAQVRDDLEELRQRRIGK